MVGIIASLDAVSCLAPVCYDDTGKWKYIFNITEYMLLAPQLGNNIRRKDHKYSRKEFLAYVNNKQAECTECTEAYGRRLLPLCPHLYEEH